MDRVVSAALTLTGPVPTEGATGAIATARIAAARATEQGRTVARLRCIPTGGL
jgi:hypothetical protein